MAERQSMAPSRATSLPRRPISRPNSLTIPNPDVFSDDYALEPLDGSPDISPIDSIQNSVENLSFPVSHNRQSIPPPFSTYTHYSRPSSTSKGAFQDGSTGPPHRTISTVSNVESMTQRTSSTSSRFSMPREQSPYAGSGGPSHPYAMYPQVTRASSIASESTIRPVERAFVATAGPEHPYSMYPQNALPEEEDSSLAPSSIPVGFPGMGRNYQTRVAGNDIADIVGADGHIEELPPYTRYPENSVPKESSESGIAVATIPPMSPTSQNSDSSVRLNTGALRQAENDEKCWKRRANKRICFGMPLWVLLLIVVITVVVGGLGGVIGSVVGKDSGADANASATKTVWVDASPLPTISAVPTYPTGSFDVLTGADQLTVDSSSCVVRPEFSGSWGCLQSGSMDIGINCNEGLGTPATEVYFPDYSKLQPYFQYGAQPPNLTQRSYELAPSSDKDDGSFSLFFATLFTKVTIVPEEAVGSDKPPSSYSGRRARIGETPWVCYWEQSVFEFFLYPNETLSPSSTSLDSSTITTAPTSSVALSRSTSQQIEEMSSAAATTQTSESSPSSWSESYPTPPPPPPSLEKRSHSYPSTYPRAIKMVEKRKPAPNPEPYCVKMEVLPDWSLRACPGYSAIEIEEVDYPSSAETSGSSRRWVGSRFKRDTTSSLLSNCACEWLTT